MSFCSFSKEASIQGKTSIDNVFITNYLPFATDNAVKVYLYGLYACQNNGNDDINAFAYELNLTVYDVKEAFKFWDDYGILSIVTNDPFTIKYYPLTDAGLKYRKFKPEKYADFTKMLQLLITERMISVSEFNEYFNLMESTSIKPEALLMIVKYCIDLKGADIGVKYILAVAKDFISRGITTAILVERELSDFNSTTKDVCDLLNVMKVNKKPEIEDQQYYKKWTENYGYQKDILSFIIKNQKIKNFKKLDLIIEDLYSNKCFSEESVSYYFKNKEYLRDLAIKINNQLGIYIEVVDPVINSYVAPWVSKGYDEEALLYIANRNWKKNKRTLEQMNETVNTLYQKGLVTRDSITEFITKSIADEKFISTLLQKMGENRNPNEWDKENISAWRSWNFTNEMIFEAAKRSAGKPNPIAYINSILSNWKNKGIYTIEAVNEESLEFSKTFTKSTTYDKKYTNEELVNRVNAKYLELKTKEETRLNAINEKLKKASGYLELENEIGKTNLKLAKAEYDEDLSLSLQIKNELNELYAKKSAILKENGIKEADLKPKHVCKDCNDTGYVNGVRCNCFYNYLEELTNNN